MSPFKPYWRTIALVLVGGFMCWKLFFPAISPVPNAPVRAVAPTPPGTSWREIIPASGPALTTIPESFEVGKQTFHAFRDDHVPLEQWYSRTHTIPAKIARGGKELTYDGSTWFLTSGRPVGMISRNAWPSTLSVTETPNRMTVNGSVYARAVSLEVSLEWPSQNSK